MALRMIVSFKAKSGTAGEVAKAFAPVVEDYRSAPGCQQYEVFSSVTDPEKFVVLQQWSSQEDLDNYSVSQRRRGVSPIAEYRDGDSKIERFTV